jgi:putative component of membrane protein insertase Oxa1/YidC/SpoIIIJ protein YidD
MRALALAAIRGYQRFLSPLKGFSCAFRVFTGAESCSSYGYRVIERFGLRRGLGLLDRRLALCGHVHRSARPVVHHPLLHRQRGECDLPCDAGCCDLHHAGHCAGDLFSSCSGCGDCSWGRRTPSEAWEKEQRHLQAITERAERRRDEERQRKKQKPVK